MGWRVRTITRAVAGLLLAGAAAADAQLALRVDDVREPEGSTGGNRLLQVPVRLPGPPPSNVTVNWYVFPGSATQTPGNDYGAPTSGSLTFPAFIDAPQFINLQVNADSLDEWNLAPLFMQDEVFFVQLTNPTGPAFIDKGLGTVTLLDDDRALPGVQYLTASSGRTGPIENRLQWRVPASPALITDIVVRWNTGASCTFPSTHTGGSNGASLGSVAGPGQVQTWPHTAVTPGLPYCYSVFTMFGGTPTAEAGQVKITPFDGSGTIAWTHVTSGASVVPPTIGLDGIYTVDNQGVVFAVQRGPNGGMLPAPWNPVGVGKPSQNRSAVVPMKSVPAYSDYYLFLGTDNGGVHALDAKAGTVIWSRSTAFNNALPSAGFVQSQPAGLFKSFNGLNDMLLVGTAKAGGNIFYALRPATGNDIVGFGDPAMGEVKGMASVDYAANRVYFLTASPSATFWAMDLGTLGSPSLSLSTLPGGNRRPFGSGSLGSMTLRNGRAVFGDSSGQVFGIDLATGTSYNNGTADGQVKGFLWPDRRDTRLYFATNGFVHGWRDDGGSFAQLWSVPVVGPSMVLQKPGSDYLYVGDGNGRLIQIDVADQSTTSLTLESGGVQIGAPSYDNVHNLVIVGSSTGKLHAVRVPF